MLYLRSLPKFTHVAELLLLQARSTMSFSCDVQIICLQLLMRIRREAVCRVVYGGVDLPKHRPAYANQSSKDTLNLSSLFWTPVYQWVGCRDTFAFLILWVLVVGWVSCSHAIGPLMIHLIHSFSYYPLDKLKFPWNRCSMSTGALQVFWCASVYICLDVVRTEVSYPTFPFPV